jgi:hypothetical protein
MTAEQIIIALIRIAGSLPVLRWPFWGALVGILVDFSDLFWMNLIDLGGLGDYQSFDKWVDLVYMVTFLVVALRWTGLAKRVAVGLFVFRIAGDIVFEATGTRAVLLVFPNVFEFWFVFVAARDQFRPSYKITTRRAVVWLIVLTAAKEFQEYALHMAKWLDRYTFFEFWGVLWRVATPW